MTHKQNNKKKTNNIIKGLTIENATKNFLTQKKAKLKESTFSQYSFICERHIIPYFKDLELAKIDNNAINSFIEHKINHGGLRGTPISLKTINDIICLLLQIVRSYSTGDITIEKPTYRQKEITIFTEKEYTRLKTHVSIGIDNKNLGIIITMLTGIRIGELCALKWENIDLENGTISINKTIQRIKETDSKKRAKTKVVIDDPKSPASIRIIPIPTILHNILREFKSHEELYILTNSKSYIEPRTYQKHFKNCLKACDIKDNKFHTLRHTFATTAISRGMDIKTLSILLGHTDVGFTMKRYVHPNIEHRRKQIEKLATDF